MKTEHGTVKPEWIGPWRLWWLTVTHIETDVITYHRRHWLRPFVDENGVSDAIVGPTVRRPL